MTNTYSPNTKGRAPHNPENPPKLVLETYFPTLLAFQDWPDSLDLNTHLKEQIYALKKSDPKGIERSNMQRIGAWHSKTNLNHLPEFADFTARVTAAVQDYFDQLGYDPAWKATCDNMWANVSPKYAYNRSHSHGGSLCSGVYYVQASSDSGRINFVDPREQAVIKPHYTEEALKNRAHTWTKVYYDPIPGRIILFPGWLRHDVDPNMSDAEGDAGDRISISFNFYQKRPETIDS